jgi:hypothetical protein
MAAAAQRGEVATLRVADHHDVASAAAVPSVGSAARHVGLAAKADHAVAAAAALDIDLRSVEEHPAKLEPVLCENTHNPLAAWGRR